jgi:hypothetical protein
MSYQQEVFAFLTRLTGNNNKIVVERAFCEFMGSLEGGVFLCQLLYWCDKGSKEWFYKSHKEWHAETFLSEYQIRQATKRCVELGFLETKLKRANGAPTMHYKVDGRKFMDSIMKNLRIESEKFENQIPKNLRMDSEKFEDVLTETTTEITTENTSSSSPTPSRNKDDDKVIFDAWSQNIPGMMTPILAEKLHALIDECGVPSVLAGITTGVEAGARNLKYITACARNHAAGKDKSKATSSYRPKLTEQERTKLLTRAKVAQSASRTAEQFGGVIDPAWQRDITRAREAGVI